MSEWIFDKRKKALEEMFIQKREKDILERMKREKEVQDQRQILHELSGIQEERTLNAAIQLGLNAETFSALTLVPLIEIAWADKLVDPREKEAILQAAESEGISRTSAAYSILESWLQREKPPQLFPVWRDFIQALGQKLSAPERENLKRQILDRAKSVALISGGVPVLGSLSQEEREVLTRLEDVFQM